MKKLGFGCMRFPMKDKEVDIERTSIMVDKFLSEGFTYFDTAHGYIDEKSEPAIKKCLTSRYDRDKYSLTNKLTDFYFKKKEDIRPFFESQLENCGVEYFDYYLMHALNKNNYKLFKRCNAFKIAEELKAEGKIRHIGMSFHDSAETLDMILSEQPSVEVVQIQFNYLDYDDPGVQSAKCLEVCIKHGKPVIIMEPVKGGSLVNLPDEGKKVLDSLGGGSYASYAIRFAASFDGVFMVLSGMSTIEQLDDNTGFMKDFKPFTSEEYEAVKKVRDIIRREDLISCTGCHYCTAGCPKKINIPEIFACYNAKKQRKDWNNEYYYDIHTKGRGKPEDCIKCGKCEAACPQHLNIRELLADVAKEFKKD